MEYADVTQAIFEKGLSVGRMISGSKSGYRLENPNNEPIFNANIVTVTHGKVWYGDLDLTLDASLLKEIAKIVGEPLFVLREMDARFETESQLASILIKKAVWNSNE